MTTALTIVTRTLKQINVVGKGMDLDDDDGLTCLEELNAMIDELRTESLAVVAYVGYVFTLTAGIRTYSIGDGATFNMPRPPHIAKAFVVMAGTTTRRQLTEMDMNAYFSIPAPLSSGSPPEYFYYQPTVPEAAIYLYPVPTVADELRLIVQSDIGAFAGISDDIDLAPGYENMLVYNLAVRVAPLFNQEPSPTLIRMAQNAKRSVKRVNTRAIHLNIEMARARNRTNIITGP